MSDEVAPLRALRAFAEARLLPTVNLPGDAMREAILIAHFARATSTVDAIVVLAERGLGSQALMLNRALYELMINAWWSRLDVDAAEELYVGFARLDWQLRRDKTRSYPGLLGELAEQKELSNEDRARLIDIYGASGHKGWTGRSLRKRITDLKRAGRGPGLRDPLAFYDVVTYLSNQELHGSSWSLARIVRGATPPGGGPAQLQIRTSGTETDLADLAVRCAWWMYSQLIELLVDEFEVPIRDELRRVLEQGADAFGLDATGSPGE